MTNFMKEFKEFAVKGNVIDMAVGIVIGAAFTSIVTSLVNDVMMPLFGYMVGGIDFSNLKWILVEAKSGDPASEVSIKYGFFINKMISFMIVALSVFLMVKVINRLRTGKNATNTTKAS